MAAALGISRSDTLSKHNWGLSDTVGSVGLKSPDIISLQGSNPVLESPSGSTVCEGIEDSIRIVDTRDRVYITHLNLEKEMLSSCRVDGIRFVERVEDGKDGVDSRKCPRQSDWMVTPIDLGPLKGDDRFRGRKRMENDKHNTEAPRFPLKISVAPVHLTNTAVNEVSFLDCKSTRMDMSSVQPNRPFRPTPCNNVIDHRQSAVEGADDSSDEEVKGQCCRLKCRIFSKRQPVARNCDAQTIKVTQNGPHPDLVISNKTMQGIGAENEPYPCPDERCGQTRDVGIAARNTLLDDDQDKIWERKSSRTSRTVEIGFVGNVDCDLGAAGQPVNRIGKRPWEGSEKKMSPGGSELPELSHTVCSFCMSLDDIPLNKTNQDKVFADSARKVEKVFDDKACQMTTNAEGLLKMDDRNCLQRQHTLDDEYREVTDSVNNEVSCHDTEIEPPVSKVIDHKTLCSRGHGASKYVFDRYPLERANEGGKVKCLEKDVSIETVVGFSQDPNYPLVEDIGVGAKEGLPNVAESQELKTSEKRTASDVVTKKVIRRQVDRECDVKVPDFVQAGTMTRIVVHKARSKENATIHAQFLPGGASNLVGERKLDSSSSTIYIEDQEDPARVEGSKKSEHGCGDRPVNNISERDRVVSTREKSHSSLPMGGTGEVRELKREAFKVTEMTTAPIKRGSGSEKVADQSSSSNSDVFGSCVSHSVVNRARFNPEESLDAGDDNNQVIVAQPHPNAQVLTRVEDQKPAYSKDKTACHDKSGQDSKFHTLDNDIEVNMCLSEKVKFFIRNSWDGTIGDSGLVSLLKGFSSPSEVLQEPSSLEWDQNLSNAHDYVTKSWTSSLTGHSNQLAQAQNDHLHWPRENQDNGVSKYKELLPKRGSQITDTNQPHSFHNQGLEERSPDKDSMPHKCLPETKVTEVFPFKNYSSEQCPVNKQASCNLPQQQQQDISERDDCIHLIESDSERETWLVSAAHVENEGTQVSVGRMGTTRAFIECPTMTPSPNSQDRCEDSQYFSDHDINLKQRDDEGAKTLSKPRNKTVHSDRSEDFHTWKAIRAGTTPPGISSYEKQLATRADCTKATISISPTRVSETSDAEKIGCLIELRKSLLRLARESGKKDKLETRKSSEKEEASTAVRSLQRQRIKRSIRNSSTSGTLHHEEGKVIKKHTFKMLDRRKEISQSGTQLINRNQIPDCPDRVDSPTASRVHERSLLLSFEPRQHPEGKELGESSSSRTETTEPDFLDSEISNVNCTRMHAEAAAPTRCKIPLGSLSSYSVHDPTNSGSMPSLCSVHSTETKSCTHGNVPPQLVYEEPVTVKKQTGTWKTAGVRRLVIAEKDDETAELEGDLITESSPDRLRRKWRKLFPSKGTICTENGSEVARGVNTDDDPWKSQSRIEVNVQSSSSRSGQERIVSEVERKKPQTCKSVQIGPINEKSRCDVSSQCEFQNLEENSRKVSVASTCIEHTGQSESQEMILGIESSNEQATMCSTEERILQCQNPKCLRSWKVAKSPSSQPRALTPTAKSLIDHGISYFRVNDPKEIVSQHCTQTELPERQLIEQGFTSATCSFGENLSPSKELGNSTEGLSPEAGYPLALNTRTEEMHFGSHRISLIGRPLRKDLRDACLVVKSTTKSQLECNNDLNNPKVISEYKILPTLLSPRNIRVKALLTFGMERPRDVAQVKEERINEAKQNSGDMEDKSATHTNSREILISPKAHRFSKATLSAMNQPVATQLAEERVCVKRQKISERQVHQVHKALKSATCQSHQRSLSISEKNLYDMEALTPAATNKNHRHPKESCWHCKAAELERVNEDLSGQIRELQNEIDSYGYLPDFIGPETNRDTFNPTLDQRETSPGCLLKNLSFDSTEGAKLPDPDHDVDISSSRMHAVKPVSKKKKKLVDSLHVKLEGNSSNAMNFVGSMNELGALYGEMQEKVDGTLPSWAKVRDMSPSINIWDTRKCAQEGHHLWLVHPDEQVHTAERRRSVPKLRPASPCSHRSHQKMPESVFTRPQVSQKSRPTQQELRDMDDPYVHYPFERWRGSYLEKPPGIKSGMLFQTCREVDKAVAYNISRVDKFNETDGCGALHDLLGPTYTRGGSTEKSRRGGSSCNHPSSAPTSVYPPRRGLFGGGRLPKRSAPRFLLPKKWGPNGQVMDHRGGLSTDDVLRKDMSRRSAELECNNISTLEQSVFVTSGQLHNPASHQPNTEHQTENNTSDSTDCRSQSASATGTSSPDDSMMQNNPKASGGKQGYLETAHGYKVVRPAVSIKKERGGPVEIRGCASSGEALRHGYTTAVIAPHITKIMASHK